MREIAIVDPPANTLSPIDHYTGLLPKQEITHNNFLQFVIGENRVYRWIMILLIYGQFILFKQFYPFPDFFSDSYSYIDAAYRHLNANIWPIGYSKFLWLFHYITYSALALNFFQYTIMILAGLYFYKTIVYFYPTSKRTRAVLAIFFFFNPLNLYLANYISSDGLFVALSLIWLTELLWILNRPALHHTIILSIVFLIAFTFRYNALFYPIITALVFLVSKQNIWNKIAGIILGPLLIIPVIITVSNAAKDMSGTAQFPPILGGWQWGNNALYFREYVEEDTLHFPTPQMAELDQIARTYYRTMPPHKRELSSYVGNFFIKQWDAPLKIYMLKHYPDSDVSSWAKVAPLFGEYGLYIIKRHPLEFVQHYILINTKNYFFPPMEKLELYNLGGDEMWPIAAWWFKYPSTKMTVISKNLQGYILLLLPFIFLLLNIYGIWGLIYFIKVKGFKNTSRIFGFTILLLAIVLILNFLFSVFANIIVMRYQIFPLIAGLVFVLLLSDYLELNYRTTATNKKLAPATL